MTDFKLTDVVEVVETLSVHQAQLWLDAGYRLLDVSTVHIERRNHLAADGSPSIVRVQQYVLGRNANTAAVAFEDIRRANAANRAEAIAASRARREAEAIPA